MTTMNFILQGRDQLSRVLDRAGRSADDLGRRLLAASINGDAAMRRFTNNASRNLSELDRDSQAGEKALEALKKSAISLAPAAIPAAASLVPLAASAGAVAVASLALGAALIPQISALSEASDAQTKYQDAVAKNGATSQQAIKAQMEYQRTLAALPPKTREAAVAVGILKSDFKDWSDSLSGATMEPFIKGVSIANSLLPKTSGLVKNTAAEADRFMTIIGGEMASPGLDRLNTKFTAFATRTLRSVNDEFVHLLRVTDSGQIGGAAVEFFNWARAQGPAVGAILRDVATALVHILDAGADVGVGMLQVVGVLADLVSAVPPSAIAMFLQLAIALKATRLAAAGLAAGRAALVGFAAQLVSMNTAAAAAPGRLAAVRAGIMALSRTAKVAMAGTGIGLLLIAISELSSRSEQAPPDVDKLTSSLRTLGSTGKATGEAAKAFGSDLSGLFDKVSAATEPGKADKVQQWIVTLGGIGDWDSTPVKNAKENIDAIDKALAGLVQNGQADLAAAALKKLSAEYAKGGHDSKELTSKLDDYKSAIADAKFEQQLAAESMGLFGAQAQKTQAALAAQKQSADGLRQSIQALNDVNRQGLGGMIGFEASIDAAAKSARENAGALSMTNGQLNLGSDKARNAATALQDLASKTDEAAASARESGSSWETVSGIYSRGRASFIENARAMGLSRAEAGRLADQIMRIPDKKSTRYEMRTEDAVAGLGHVISAMKKAPNSKSVTVKALTSDAVSLLRDLGFKVTRLKDGRFKVTAETANAKANIAAVQKARDALKSKSIDLAARDHASAAARAIRRAVDALRSKTITITTVRATIATYNTSGRPSKGEGGVSKYAAGGTPSAGEVAMVGENGPELVVFGEAARVFDSTTTRALQRGTVTAGLDVGRGLAAGMSGSMGTVTAGARSTAGSIITAMKDELQIASPSKRAKALAADVGKGLIAGLTGSRDKIKATSKDLAKDIWSAFSGKKDNRLVAWVNKQTKTLLTLAGKRDSLIATIKRAKDFAESTRVNAKASASLGGMFSGEETVTASGISSILSQRLAKMKQFSSLIGVLAKRGLNKTMLREILEMGPEQGYAYASALAGANSKLFKEINSTQYAINSEADKLGKKGADALYDSGKNAGKGFLAGLQSQQKAIENQMIKIAKGMDKAIRKALGIKSPSRVMAEIGRYSTEGLAVGLTERTPVLDRALSEVSGRVAATRPVLGRPAVTVGAGGGGMTVNVNIASAMDPVAVAREVQRVLVRYGRAQGATVSLKVGG